MPTRSGIEVEISAPCKFMTIVSPSHTKGSVTACAAIRIFMRTRVLLRFSRAIESAHMACPNLLMTIDQGFATEQSKRERTAESVLLSLPSGQRATWRHHNKAPGGITLQMRCTERCYKRSGYWE